MSEYKKKFVLDEERIPKAWYNIVPDLPAPPAAAAQPGDAAAGRPRRPRADLPAEHHRAGGLGRALHRDPRRGPPDLPHVEADAAHPRHRPREGARHAGQDLLQVRGRQPGRLAQEQHRRRAGLLQQAGRHHAARHRDRRRPVGQRPQHGLPDVRPRVHGLHGQGELPPEAVPAQHDAALGRQRDPQPQRPDQRRSRRAGRGPGVARQPRHRHQRGRRGRRHAPRLQVRARQRRPTTCSCTRRSSARRRSCSARTPTPIRTSSSAASAAARASAGSPSRSCARTSPARRTRASSPWSRPPARRSPRASSVYDFGDEAQTTPLFKMYTLGHDFMPPGIHAGGLRYHGMAPLLSHVYDLGLMEAVVGARRPRSSRRRSSSRRPRASSRRRRARTRSAPRSTRR